MCTTNCSSNPDKNVSIFLPYPNPHVLDWVLKLKKLHNLNIGCAESTHKYRPGYFEEYNNMPDIHYFFKKRHKKEFYDYLKGTKTLISLGLFHKELLRVGLKNWRRLRLIVLSEPFNPINSNKRSLLRETWCWIIRRLFIQIDFLCIGGIEVKNYYQRLGFTSSRYIQFGYFPDLDSNVNAMQPANCGARLSDEVVITFIGQLIPRKGIDRLFRLMDFLKNTPHRHKLNIVGEGILEDQLLLKIKEIGSSNVTHMGLVSDKDRIRKILKRTDILFIPSYFDGWGAVVNEAISQGCAIISSDRVFSSKILVEHGQNGFIFINDFETYFETYFNDKGLLSAHKAASTNMYYKWNSESVAVELSKILRKENSTLLIEL